MNNHYRQHDAYTALSYNCNPLSWLGVTAGYDLRYSSLDADLRGFSGVRRIDAKAVLSVMSSWKGLDCSAVVLYQHIKDSTWTRIGAAEPLDRITPSFSLSYTYRGLTARVWYKDIFRAPTLNDLYYT